MSIIVKTINNAMLQDVIKGAIYTPRRPHLTEMNSFVESFVNSQSTGTQGGAAVRRPKQLEVLCNSDELENLNAGVTDKDLEDDWVADMRKLRASQGNKAVDQMSDADWKKWCQDWVKKNSGKKTKAENPAATDEGKSTEGKPADGAKKG